MFSTWYAMKSGTDLSNLCILSLNWSKCVSWYHDLNPFGTFNFICLQNLVFSKHVIRQAYKKGKTRKITRVLLHRVKRNFSLTEEVHFACVFILLEGVHLVSYIYLFYRRNISLTVFPLDYRQAVGVPGTCAHLPTYRHATGSILIVTSSVILFVWHVHRRKNNSSYQNN